MERALTGSKCYTIEQIKQNGGVVNENSNGTVSVFIPDNVGTLVPAQLSYVCCTTLSPNYYFDVETQKCMWKKPTQTISTGVCDSTGPIKLVLNPQGNDGTIFYVDANQTCDLTIDFKYLFKVKCDTLAEILKGSSVQQPINPETATQIKNYQSQLDGLMKECGGLAEQIKWFQNEIENTSYSVICNSFVTTPIKTTAVKTQARLSNFTKTGFGSTSQSPVAPFSFDLQDYTNINLCLTEPDGLTAWENILGPQRFNDFKNGDINSFTCEDVTALINQNNINLFSNPVGPVLFNTCDIPFGTKTELIIKQNALIAEQRICQGRINELTSLIESLTQTNVEQVSSCKSPINFFESFEVKLILEVLSGTTLVPIATYDLFNQIGGGNLYDYLVSHPNNSGFYVCDDNGVTTTPISFNIKENSDDICIDVVNNLLSSLYEESGLSADPNGPIIFESTLPDNSLASNWLNFNQIVTDTDILAQIADKKIKISLQINNACTDFCVLIDEIVLDKKCTEVDTKSIFVTQAPGFGLERIRDNKKSWVANTTPENRPFVISNNKGGQSIRQTNYDVNDERLVINSKEIDLDISLASGIETDVWCFISDNPCILTGITTCLPCFDECGSKSFQDDECFAFMDGEFYDFMDGFTTGNTSDFNFANCCGDNKIDFSALLTQPLSSVTTIEDFEYYLTSELIDAKNRQTISSYPTLRALYDRYMSSYDYCSAISSAFDYIKMDQFAGLIDDYWVDIVEQVVPATTIWGSVKVYSNTLFDQQKYKYKSYSSLFCENQFAGTTVLSPINGAVGMSADVEVITTPLNIESSPNVRMKNPVGICNKLHIAQMNSGSEFVGSVQVIKIDIKGESTGSEGIGGGKGSYVVIENFK